MGIFVPEYVVLGVVLLIAFCGMAKDRPSVDNKDKGKRAAKAGPGKNNGK